MEPETESRRARILVADDEEDLLDLMRLALAPLDAEVTSASDGAEAIRVEIN
jgi:CheY-like chemotaxis protein